jgi:Uma2 family endonuclease
MATEVRKRITVEEFRERDDLPRFTQLIDGEIVLNAPKVPHQLACGRLFIALSGWATAQADRGAAWIPLDVELDRFNLYEPDVLWTSEDHLPDREHGLESIPDLCVEVRSPSTWRYDIGIKKTNYERHGLPELWLVDTEAESVLVFRRSTPQAPAFDVSLELTKSDTLISPQLPGFECALDELFAPLR